MIDLENEVVTIAISVLPTAMTRGFDPTTMVQEIIQIYQYLTMMIGHLETENHLQI